MHILVIGNGAREHALAWAVSGSPLCSELYCLPGNAGTSQIAENVAIDVLDFDAIEEFSRQRNVDFVIIGPEEPLAVGIVDRLEAANIRCFGPSQAAARLESSKVYTKRLCQELGIPTAPFLVSGDYSSALARLESASVYPVVMKLDRLAGGKGVIIIEYFQQGKSALQDIYHNHLFGEDPGPVLFEPFLSGEEISYLALVDGQHILAMPTVRDYKRAYDGDKGPNTGGMGAISPSPLETPELLRDIEKRFIAPIVAKMAADGTPYRGVLFAGFMVQPSGELSLLEINCRFGDPECQAMLMRLRSDLLPALIAVRDGMISHFDLRWDDRTCVSVVLANSGYPAEPKQGETITGLSFLANNQDTAVFHGGTALKDKSVIANGGRVITISALGETMDSARENAYRSAQTLLWPGVWMRHDIALRGSHKEIVARIAAEPELLEQGLRVIQTPSPDPLIDLSCRDNDDRLTAVILHRSQVTGDLLDRTHKWIIQARGWEGEARMILVAAKFTPSLQGRAASVNGLRLVQIPDKFLV